MKLKKNFYFFVVLIIAVVTAVNVNINSKEDGLSDVFLANVEALADNESNPWYLWAFQGTTKDEKEIYATCSWSWEFNFVVYKWFESGSGTKKMCEDGGSNNCSTGSCTAS
jgi:hypothetical protein